MSDAFDKIQSAAINFAEEKRTLHFHTLISGLEGQESQTAMVLLKFINEMLLQSEADKNMQAKFLAKLEGLNINELL